MYKKDACLHDWHSEWCSFLVVSQSKYNTWAMIVHSTVKWVPGDREMAIVLEITLSPGGREGGSSIDLLYVSVHPSWVSFLEY